MGRVNGWQRRLFVAIRDRKNTPFAWGENDCLMFSAVMVFAVTGKDPAAPWRGTYTTRQQAAALIRQIAKTGDIFGVIDKFFDRIPIKFAQRGDLVAAEITDRGPTIGVCAGGGCYFVGPDGLIKFPLQNCVTAWRVK